jgi:hypothetical protein
VRERVRRVREPAPGDIYLKHSYCRCLVLFIPKKGDLRGVQDSHTKKWHKTEADVERRREALRNQDEVFIAKSRKAAAKAAEAVVSPQYVKGFVPAKTLREADDYAKHALGVPSASYKGVSVSVANAWNNGLKKAFDDFPELKNRCEFVGEAHERNRILRPKVRAYYENKVNRTYAHLPAFERKLLISKKTSHYMRSVEIGPNTIAESFWDVIKGANGISINGRYGKDAVKLTKMIEADVANKFHPVGTGTIQAVLDHEIGHQLDTLLNISQNMSVRSAFGWRSQRQITNELSTYAWDNGNKDPVREFVAEAWAEYRNNPNPRNIALMVGGFIEKEYARKY